MPVPRTDLLDLLGAQDKIANRAKDIAGIMLGRQMAIPKPLQKPIVDYLKRSLAASEQAVKVIDELDDLVETGFGGREIKLIEKMITKLNSIESETDQIEIKIRGELFKIEMELNSIESIKNAVQSGLGAAFVSVSAIAKELELGLLHWSKIENITIKRTLSVLTNPNRYSSKASETFSQEILTLFLNLPQYQK